MVRTAVESGKFDLRTTAVVEDRDVIGRLQHILGIQKTPNKTTNTVIRSVQAKTRYVFIQFY